MKRYWTYHQFQKNLSVANCPSPGRLINDQTLWYLRIKRVDICWEFVGDRLLGWPVEGIPGTIGREERGLSESSSLV